MPFRFLLIVALLAFAVGDARAGVNPESAYTERGKADFDTFLQLLNPYGTWSKVDGKWAFQPSDHLAPYTSGRWLYTEYGWYWKGTQPHSWATEHYGYWKRNAAGDWLWYPGAFWLPQIVEFRASNTHIGWRSAEVTADGNFVEVPLDRYAKTGEWTFVTLAQFANPITPKVVADEATAKTNLESSTDCRHTYMTYRVIDRPGPHPADVADLCKDGHLLAPKSMSDLAAERAPKPKPPATNSPAAQMTGTNGPAFIGTDVDPSADTRKVKYWVTMSLPTFWTAPPAEAKAEEIYFYRPDTFQDQDGIKRRIDLWFDPKQRTRLKDLLGSGASVPAKSESAPSKNDPFHSPIEDPVRPATSATTNAPAKGAVPSGLQH